MQYFSFENMEVAYISASLPWLSPDSTDNAVVKTSRYTCDSEEQIASCLNCPYAECVDCLTVKNAHGRPKKIDDEQLREMLRLKWSSDAICQTFGVTKRAIRKAKKRIITEGNP